MAADRTVSVVLQAKVDQFVGGMKKAEAATKTLGQQTKKTQAEQELLGKAARLVGGIALVALGKQFVSAASAMNETVSKSSVVFGKSSAAVTAWSKNSAKAMGMSQQAAIESAASFGNLFVSMGLGQAPAEQMSTSLVQLAGDLASFNNVDPATALDALRSGLVGETEPLRKFGVNLNDADLRQKAMAMGLTNTTTAVLPPAIKTQAAYALILEQTKTAQGDYARTGDGLANSQRTLTAEWQDAQAKLGQDLLPAVNSVVHGLNSMLDVVNAAPTPVRNAGLAVGALGAALFLMAPRLLAAKAAFELLPASAQATAKGMAGVIGKFTALIAVADIATHAVSAFGDQSVNGGMTLETLEKQLLSSGKAVDGLGYKMSFLGATDVSDLNQAIATLADPGNMNKFTSGIEGMLTGTSHLSQASATVTQLDSAIADLAGNGHLPEARKRFDEFRTAYLASGGSVDEFNRAMVNSKAAIDAALVPATSLAAAQQSAATTAKAAAAANDALKASLDALGGKTMSLAEANISLYSSFNSATDAAKTNGRTLNEHTAKGQANISALMGIAKAADDAAVAYDKNGKSSAFIKAKMDEARGAFIAAAEKMGLTKTAAEKLATAYGLVPKTIATRASLTGTDAAIKKARDLAYAISTIGQQWAQVQRLAPALLNAHFGVTTKKAAAGGYISGPGTGTSDSIPARLSNGEYVMSAKAVASYGSSTFDALNSGSARTFASGGMVSIGGTTGYASRTTGSLGSSAAFSGVPGVMIGGDGIPVMIQLDSQNVWKALLKFRHGPNGGAALGFDS